MTDLIQSRDAGAIRYLTLNRPDKLNALNDELVAQLTAALIAADADPAVAVIVLAANGRAFSAGADLRPPATPPTHREVAASLASTIPFYSLVMRLDTPVIAAVQGYALGGGCNLAVCCDLVVAADNAMFGYPEVKLGMVAAGVAPALVHQIGRKAAFELLVLCENINAQQALTYGMINRVVALDDLLPTVTALAEKLAAFDADALRLTKQLIRRAADLPLPAAFELGRDLGLAMHLFK